MPVIRRIRSIPSAVTDSLARISRAGPWSGRTSTGSPRRRSAVARSTARREACRSSLAGGRLSWVRVDVAMDFGCFQVLLAVGAGRMVGGRRLPHIIQLRLEAGDNCTSGLGARRLRPLLFGDRGGFGRVRRCADYRVTEGRAPSSNAVQSCAGTEPQGGVSRNAASSFQRPGHRRQRYG